MKLALQKMKLAHTIIIIVSNYSYFTVKHISNMFYPLEIAFKVQNVSILLMIET